MVRMVDQLLGSYNLDRNENFEEFLTITGVPLVARKMMAATSPRITIAREGDKWTLAFKLLIKSNSISFELGKEFTEDNPISGEKNKVQTAGREKGVHVFYPMVHVHCACIGNFPLAILHSV